MFNSVMAVASVHESASHMLGNNGYSPAVLSTVCSLYMDWDRAPWTETKNAHEAYD